MKKLTRFCGIPAILFFIIVLSGCATTAGKAFQTNESQVKLRSMQTRAFDTTDKKKMMQTVGEQSFEAQFKANTVHLMQSVLTPSGSEYQSVHAWKLLVR